MRSLIQLTACEIVDLLDQGQITPLETLEVLQERIVEVDGQVNALPTLCFERAREHAQRLMDVPAMERGILRGLPIPIKDLMPVAGVCTTLGSKVYKDFVPEKSDILVERLEENGAVIYAKSNTPEFGAGGNTFNDVFGATHNPHDLSLSAGGSSGGAAAALACGTAWLAHGSDMAGSLRTPASFCGVTSLRPSPGLIGAGPKKLPFQVLAQDGPMARTVSDLALLTDVMAGECPMIGLSKPTPNSAFRAAAAQPVRPTRVAFSADLGVTETSSEVLAACQVAMAAIAKSGVVVEQVQFDLSEAHEAFSVLRALSYAVGYGDDLAKHRELIKPEVVWNIEQGLALDGAAIRGAVAAQGRVFEAAARFMQHYDLLVCPATIVPPFPVEERYLGYSQGVEIPGYYRWLAIAYAISVTTLPVIAMPCGTTTDGLPVGIQLVGRPHGERRLFAFASYVEQLLDCDSRPIEPTKA